MPEGQLLEVNSKLVWSDLSNLSAKAFQAFLCGSQISSKFFRIGYVTCIECTAFCSVFRGSIDNLYNIVSGINAMYMNYCILASNVNCSSIGKLTWQIHSYVFRLISTLIGSAGDRIISVIALTQQL